MDHKYAKLFAGAASAGARRHECRRCRSRAGRGLHLGFSNSGARQRLARGAALLRFARRPARRARSNHSTSSIATPTQSGQIEDIDNLSAAGVDAIVLNPSSPDALNTAIKDATDEGIVVVAVDSVVTEPSRLHISNDQEQLRRDRR